MQSNSLGDQRDSVWRPRGLPRGTRRPIECGHTQRRHKARGMCSACYAKTITAPRDTNRKNRATRSYYLRHYGISLEEYEEISRRQDDVCMICMRPCKTGRRLAIDHDHKRKTRRALLCGECNTGLGKFREKPELMIAAMIYLFRYGSISRNRLVRASDFLNGYIRVSEGRAAG